jgi:hypothetical protein
MDRIPPQLRSVGALLVILLNGCGPADGRADGQSVPSERPAVFDSARPWRKPGDKIDSIRPMKELLEGFRGAGPAPARLTGGSASRNGLVRRFLAAVSVRDTAALQAMQVSRNEFGWLVFPEHLYSDPPYELDPEIFWLQLQGRSANGIGKVLARLGGRTLRLAGLECRLDTLQGRSPEVLFWSPCRVRFLDGDSVQVGRIFGTIVEHRGMVKFLSYANEY